MSKFSRFMKDNKIERKNEMYAPTKSLLGEDGSPLAWEFRHITSKENEELREDNTMEVPVAGRPGMFRSRVRSARYIQAMIVKSVVVPDLYDEQLQDSYGVTDPGDLLLAMVDDPGEYNALAAWVQKFQGFDVSFADKVEEVKN